MTKRLRIPPEKKALSYTRDRRNVYGENSKSSRKNIPRRKRTIARAERRLGTIVIAEAAKSQNVEEVPGSLFGRSEQSIARGASSRTKRWLS